MIYRGLKRARNHVIDTIIRRKAALHETPLDQFTIRVARSVEDYDAAFQLLQAVYIAKGYERPDAGDRRITPQHAMPEATVLVAEDRFGHIVGTLSVTVDGPAGLPIHEYFGEEVGQIKGAGRLAELGSFALAKNVRRSGLTALLYIAAYQIATRMYRVSGWVAAVQLKAEPIYRAVFGFERITKIQPHPSLDMKLVGLHLDLEKAHAHMQRYGQAQMSDGRIVAEAYITNPPPCLQLPDSTMNEEAFYAWKVSAEVFDTLLMPEAGWKLPMSALVAAYSARREPVQTWKVVPLAIAQEDPTIPMRRRAAQ